MASIGSEYAPRAALERTASAIASARRAVLADRYAIDSFAVEWRALSELAAAMSEERYGETDWVLRRVHAPRPDPAGGHLAELDLF